MDRNTACAKLASLASVALRKESVDRNHFCRFHQQIVNVSLSARRAWIEINIACATGFSASVALRKESVDRNSNIAKKVLTSMVALRKESVDRNFDAVQIVIVVVVALRKESVDRNVNLRVVDGSKSCRSPQGERG